MGEKDVRIKSISVGLDPEILSNKLSVIRTKFLLDTMYYELYPSDERKRNLVVLAIRISAIETVL